MKNLPPGACPDPLPREKRTPCKTDCCWTPYMCGKNRACQCHREEKR